MTKHLLDDPNFVHSEFMVVVQDFEKQVEIKEYILNERVSVSNKKKILFATEEDDKIIYTNFNWINFNN